MSRPRTEAKLVTIDGLAYGRLKLVMEIPHGRRRTRLVELRLSADAITRLADCIRGCQGVYEEPSTGKKPRDLAEALGDRHFVPIWIGHAVWHLENPEALMPCLPDGTTVIDIEKPLDQFRPRRIK